MSKQESEVLDNAPKIKQMGISVSKGKRKNLMSPLSDKGHFAILSVKGSGLSMCIRNRSLELTAVPLVLV